MVKCTTPVIEERKKDMSCYVHIMLHLEFMFIKLLHLILPQSTPKITS